METASSLRLYPLDAAAAPVKPHADQQVVESRLGQLTPPTPSASTQHAGPALHGRYTIGICGHNFGIFAEVVPTPGPTGTPEFQPCSFIRLPYGACSGLGASALKARCTVGLQPKYVTYAV